jgi:predicted DNA binding protein
MKKEYMSQNLPHGKEVERVGPSDRFTLWDPLKPMNDQIFEDLTGSQRDLLRNAVREGYFEVPRKISLAKLAEKHEISSQDASEKLRRGLDVVVHAAVFSD